MTFLAADSIELYITLTTNIVYAFLFISGCLCLGMTFTHSFTVYISSIDKNTTEYTELINHIYLIWISQSALTSTAIIVIHTVFKIPFHGISGFIIYSFLVRTFLNLAMHIDIIEMGNRDPYWLWTLYSYGENTLNILMFLTVLIARRWEEVFRWIKLAHSR
jgi:hypothetical protein